MASTCSDESVLAGLFLAAYDGKIAEVKSLLKINALAADVSDPVKVGGTVVYNMSICRHYPATNCCTGWVGSINSKSVPPFAVWRCRAPV